MPTAPSPAAVVPPLVGLATALELLATLAVVHRLVRQPMRERGLPSWTLADTLLTSPLFFVGATLFLGGVNGGILAVAGLASSAILWMSAAIAGLIAGAFGARAFGKLY